MASDPNAEIALILSAVLSETGRTERLANDVVAQAMASLGDNPEATKRFIEDVFPDGIPLDGSFYKRLYRIASVGGFNDSAVAFVGHAWSTALLHLDGPARETLLRSLPTGHEFFVLLSSLPFLLKRVRFQPSFLIQSFFEMRERIGNELCD